MADTLGNFSVVLIRIPIGAFSLYYDCGEQYKLHLQTIIPLFESVTSFSNQNKTGQTFFFNA